MREKKVLLNILSLLILQFINIVSGFIVPRLILVSYGSSINGMISSITQFLSYITLFEAGAGGVIRAVLYKPLAKNNNIELSEIIKATEIFFKTIAFIFIGYILLLSFVYPYIINNEFDWFFTFTLIVIIGFSTFMQYYFGITYEILLQADQKIHLLSQLQIFTTLINIILTIILIRFGTSVHLVKLGSSAIFVLRPLFLKIYVKNHYEISRNCKANNNSIKQKWDGFCHHIAYIMHRNTDIALLTIFTNVREVSVYTVYFMVVTGIEKIIKSISTGINATIGNMLAKEEWKLLNKTFNIYEFINFTLVTVFFTSTALLIIPFVSVYTEGVLDVNYNRPLFAYILTAAEAMYCIRLPYNSIITAAGHYKQTRNGAFIEAFVNIGISLILINILGITGVAIGTFIAITFRTIQYVTYLSNNIMSRSISHFVRRCTVNIVAIILVILIVDYIPEWTISSYKTWAIYASIVFSISSIITIFLNYIFYLNDFRDLHKIIERLILKKLN